MVASCWLVLSSKRFVHRLLLVYLTFIAIGFVTSHGGHDEGGDITGKFNEGTGFTASWVISGDHINFTLTAPTAGWVGIAFASDSVVGFDVIIGYGNNNATDKFATKDEPVAHDDVELGGTNDIIDPHVSYEVHEDMAMHESTITFTFSRKLQTGDEKADNIIAKEDITFLWAYDELTLLGLFNGNHSGVTRLNFFGSDVVVNVDMMLIRFHGFMMCTLVMLIMTSAIILSRYLKKVVHWWFYLHAFFAVLGLVLMVSSLSVIFSAHNNKFVPSWHSAFGIIFIILMGLQTLIGVYSHFAFDKFRREPPRFPDKTHWWLGRAVYFVGLLNIILGLNILGGYPGLGWFFYALWFAVVIVIVIIMEKTIGQTHETLTGHKVLESSMEEEDKEHGGGAAKRKQQRKSAEFMVMFFVPAVTGIIITYLGVVMLI